MNKRVIKKIWNTILVKQKITLFLLFFATIFMSIGYASINDVIISLSGHGNVKAVEASNTGLVITNAVYSSDNNADDEHSTMDYNGLFLDSSIILGITSESNITYQVTVQNNTSDTYKYNGLLYDETDSNFYSNSNIEVVSNHIGDYLSPGNSMTILVTYQYIDGYTPSSAETLDSYVKLDFDLRYVARIASTYYDTLQEAVDDVNANTNTTIYLLKDTEENIVVPTNTIINFDLQEHTVSATSGDVLTNSGTIEIKNGSMSNSTASAVVFKNNAGATLNILSGTYTNTSPTQDANVILNNGIAYITGGTCNGYGQAAVINNVNSTARLYISGGRLIGYNTTKGQAIWNSGGAIRISDNAYLESSSHDRGALHNASGTVTVTGGTIIGKYLSAIKNEATMTIGTKDNTFYKDIIDIQGETVGIDSSTNFAWYDGLVKGKNNALANKSKATPLEDGHGIIISGTSINGTTYQTAYTSGSYVTITFDANTGSVSETSRNVEINNVIGPLPTPTNTNYIFMGWFTDPDEGVEKTENDTFTTNTILYAHWVLKDAFVQIVSTGVNYKNITTALKAISDSTPTEIKLIRNVSDNVTIASGRNITINLNGYTLNHSGTGSAVITNNGTLTVTNGTITSTIEKAAIDQKSGNLTVNNVNISATQRGAIYMTGGTATITGNSYLTSDASGQVTDNNHLYDRAAVQVNKGTLTVLGGTIVGTNQHAIGCYGTCTATIGNKDGNINSSSPVIQGKIYGIKNEGTLKFYDGIIKGETATVTSTISDEETNSIEVTGTEGDYHTLHLEFPAPAPGNETNETNETPGD